MVFDEINLSPCWRKDKVQLHEFVRIICHGNYSIRHFVPIVFLFRLNCLSAAACFPRPVARIKFSEVRYSRKVDLLDPKSGLFEPHPLEVGVNPEVLKNRKVP